MAEIAAGVCGGVIQILQWVGAPVTRQFQYLCCFSSNITSLINETEKLQVKELDLQRKVDTARNDVRIISGEVETWLQNSNDIKYAKDEILKEARNVESGCFRLGARFSLSKRAKKTTQRLKELQDRCKFQPDDISQPAPAAASQPIPSGMTYEFESRKQIEEDIMAALRGGDVNMMGICGMGGLGKTTMAKRIMNRALEEHVFEEVVMAVVSQPIDKLKIQLDIGGTLGLELTKETPQQARVQKLHARLRGTKRILLVLDDVWDSLVLENIGIPSGYKECTILLTSRNHDVLRAMDVQKIFGMEVLSEEDSWIMFRGRVGTCVDNTELKSIAKKVVNECKGLPLALTTVGAALKDEVNVDKWKNAVRQLEKGDPDIPGFNAKVYNPLKLSYDVLEPKYQSVFLLCCLFREDADIPLEHLTYFCMGLRMFGGGIGTVEEARNRMCAWTDVLKSRSLLLDSKNGDEYVRMHDVVRDVCIFIANKEGYIGDNDCSWISLAVPNLCLLFFQDDKFTLDNSFLEGIRDLSVVCIERYSLVSLPHATQMLRNLNTLILDQCPRVQTLSVVGELENLEILICRHCDSIKELPPGIKGLKRLKVLDLTGCRYLQWIGQGIISSLVGLEELKMLRSFKRWEGEDREERENAGVRELEALTKLRWLEIEIQDPALLAAQNIRLSSKLDRFTVKFVCEEHRLSNFDKYLSKKKMRLNWEGAAGLGDWIERQLLRDTECLYLSGNGANKVELRKIEKMKMLELGRCESMKNVCASVLPSIEHLVLFELPKLEEILFPELLNCFQNVKVIKLHDLPALKQLWKSSQSDLGKDLLPKLEVLDIRWCEMMEGVFMWKGEDGNENNTCYPITIMFPKLKELLLVRLPNLTSLCQGIEGIEFPLLTIMGIHSCEKIKGMVANGVTSNENNSAHTHCHLFCESQQVSFGCLKKLTITDWNPFCSDTIHVSLFNGLEELTISKCAGSLSLFTSSMAGNLVNLKELTIRECDEMVEVIKDDDEEKAMSATALLFPKLQELCLTDLPKLVSFCGWKCDVELPSLRQLHISRCHNMKNLSLGSVAALNLEYFYTDLNNYLLQLPFNTPKILSVGGIENPLNCYEIHGSVFDRLEELTIDGYEGSMGLFSSSIAGCLVNLTTLSISYSHKMVKVIEEKEEEKEKVVSAAAQTTLLFPKLHTLLLETLPELESFCEWKCDVELPSLRQLKIEECHNMKSFTSGLLTTPNLKSVKIDITQDFGGVKDVNEFLQQCHFNRIMAEVEYGSGILEISKLAGSLSLITSSMAENLVNLNELRISECDEMVEVIKDDYEEKAMSATALLLPELHTLDLYGLPKLVSFCGWKCDVMLPSLRQLSIYNCPNMKNLSLGSLAAPNLESFDTDLNNCVLQHPFNTMKELSIKGNENPLNCYEIHGSVFDRLEELIITWYEGSMRLFSCSITGSLVNLTTLRIEFCREMVKVIEEKEEEKEKVVSAAAQTTLLFPKLHKLQLFCLPELVSFCEWKCDVELPSLRQLKINYSHNMKSFTSGLLTTPNLKSVKIDNEDFGGVKDVNEFLQQCHSNRIEETSEVATQKEVAAAEWPELSGFTWPTHAYFRYLLGCVFFFINCCFNVCLVLFV